MTIHRPKSIITGLIVSLGALIIINVILSAQLASVGMALSQSQQQTAQLEKVTSILRHELVMTTSLADLDSQAGQLGYSAQVNYHTINTFHPVAGNLTLVSQP